MTIVAQQPLTVYVNNTKIIDQNPDPSESLISFLRRNGLTGTKLGCSEGGCGSCTVMVSFYDFSGKKVVHQSINSCLALASSAHLKHVITIEGLGSSKSMHPAQQVVANANGSQCGFCTPGIVMSLYTELQTNPHPTHHSIEDAFDGNLCRCTGYRPILDGAKSLGCTGNCSTCKVTDCHDSGDLEDIAKKLKLENYGVSTLPSAVACPFPQELMDYYSRSLVPQTVSFENENVKYIHAISKNQLVQLKSEHPNAKIINGNTEVGIEVRFKNQKYPVLINTSEVDELKFMKIMDDGVEWGALTTISNFQSQLQHLINTRQEFETRGFQALLDNIKYFAGRQIRNVSAISGNICTASPISDLNPVFLALGAILTVQSISSGARTVCMSDFFLGYRKTALEATEVLISIKVPFTSPLEFTSAFKQAKRRDDDIAIVNAGLSISFDKVGSDFIVRKACFAYGGMGPFSMIAKSASAHVVGKKWSMHLFEECYDLLLNDMPLTGASPGGQIEFRKTLAQSFLFKFGLRVGHNLSLLAPNGGFEIAENEKSAMNEIIRPLSSGRQVFQERKGPGVVGKSVVHLAATKQVTGEALYTDDIPRMYNELYGVVIGSTVAHGIIEQVDTTEALKAPGVAGYVSRKDVPVADEHHGDPNMIGPVFQDEELFATKEVHCMGQMIGMIVANTEAQARYAAKLVKVTYKSLPAIFTIEDAIEAKSFFPIERKLNTGEFDDKPNASTKPAPSLPLEAAKNFVKGVARMSAQEHFYLETNASLCVPGEDGEMEVYASTQQAKETQDFVAHVVGVPYHKVVVRVKRMGGGFGGKESRSVFLSAALAVAAKKFKRPVRGMLTREEDMVMSGTRHPFRGEYTVGFTEEGKLVSLELDLYSNAGYSYDLSIAVLERSMTHCDNAYKIPNMKIHGRLCKTNTATNTAFRGFGGPQGMMIAEQAMTHVAAYLNKPVEDIRRLNLYQNGEKTHFDMPLESVFLDRAWNELQESSDFKKRRALVDEYNKKHKYRKRGITLMPTKFGLAYTARFLNQAGALVHVYTDGSIRIAHGGTEMGQGLHTKMVQVAADAFGVPLDMVHLSETRTDYVPNTSATAASVSSDINGMAVKNACDQIMERLKPIREENPTLSWPALVKKAYFERINLSANGFFKTPDLTYDWSTNTGRMFSYFTYGAVCSEVEIDTLTGDHVVLSSHMIMDIGTPINPTIDIGQIEGAFTQGMGWCTIEEPLVSPTTGFLFTRGPGLYKIPGFKDIPVDFRVTVMDGVRNSRVIHSSKAVGEPPFFLGASVFFAIRDAVNAARSEMGLNGHYRMDCPATSERIRLACADPLVARAATPLKLGEKPWGMPL